MFGGLTVPLVPELVLMRHPFSLLEITELENVTPSTTLLLLPPMEPMLSPWPPMQVMPVTRMLEPLVTATQSSWLLTTEFLSVRPLVEDMSKPSELWAAARPLLTELGAFPAVLSRLML